MLLASLALSILSALRAAWRRRCRARGWTWSTDSSRPTWTASGRKRLWGRNALVVAQVATVADAAHRHFLMSGFKHSFVQGTGFAKDRLLMAGFDPRLVQYNAAQTQQFYHLLLERAASAPASRARPSPRTRRLGSRVSTPRLRAGRIRDASRSRDIHLVDGHGR